MRVVVTGAGGFVGRVVAREFAQAGHDVIAIYRKSRAPEHAHEPRIEALHTDLRALARLPPCDGLVHCAADVPAFCPQEEELFRSNVEGTRVLFAAAAAAGARRIVYLSSMAIYGTIAAAVAHEDLPSTNPDNYGRSKLEGEKLLSALCGLLGNIGALVIRLPGVVGAGARNNFLANTLDKILRGVEVQGAHPDAIFNNVVHVEDLARFVVDRLPVLVPGTLTTTNMAACESLTLREIVGLLYAGAGRDNDSRWSNAGKQPFTISLARLESLGYVPRTVRDTLERFVRDEIKLRSAPP